MSSAFRIPTERRKDLLLRSAGIYALVLLIVSADWLTPAGIVVGILLGVPILLSSWGNHRGEVIAVSLVSVAGFFLAAIFGRGPISPQAVWLPNRLFAIVAIAASGILALILQQRRMDAEAARVDAESARDLSRLLHSLMAHDLRSPLTLARDALGAVQQPVRSGTPVDLELIADVEARLHRSLRRIQMVLDAARADLDPSDPRPGELPQVDVSRQLREEAASFSEEARVAGKELRLEVPENEFTTRVEPSVLRQSVAILVDNAIRHAAPGPVWISAAMRNGNVIVRVRDSGPGLSRRRAEAARAGGEGLGLRLCELLVHRAGGSLELACDDGDGTEFILRLPAHG